MYKDQDGLGMAFGTDLQHKGHMDRWHAFGLLIRTKIHMKNNLVNTVEASLLTSLPRSMSESL
jgi:hypothetical protein